MSLYVEVVNKLCIIADSKINYSVYCEFNDVTCVTRRYYNRQNLNICVFVFVCMLVRTAVRRSCLLHCCYCMYHCPSTHLSVEEGSECRWAKLLIMCLESYKL